VFGALTAGLERLEPTLITGCVIAVAGIHRLTWPLTRAPGTFTISAFDDDWFNARGGTCIAFEQVFPSFADFHTTGDCGGIHAGGNDPLAGAGLFPATAAPSDAVIGPLVSLPGRACGARTRHARRAATTARAACCRAADDSCSPSPGHPVWHATAPGLVVYRRAASRMAWCDRRQR